MIMMYELITIVLILIKINKKKYDINVFLKKT